MSSENDTKTEALLERIADTLDHDIQVRTGGALNRGQAARYLGVSTRTLHELCSGGDVKRVAVSPGRHVFRKAELDRYLVERQETGVDPSELEAERLYDEAIKP